ncbi:TPA: homoserine kinase [Streptococcus equi subsp. zooepidemicus]
MKIRVPATSANLGPGFDSMGIAVSKYLEVDILEERDQWFIEHDLGDIPNDDSNLLIQTALRLAPNIPAHRLKMTSDIPLARGLGSSSSVIVAGVELANQLGHLNLTDDRKLAIATRIEGHPDNVAPAIFGQLVIASQIGKDVDYIIAPFPDLSLVCFIPDYELKTSDSRDVLPKQLSYKQAVAASSVANLAIAALLTGNLKKAGRAIENDQFHEIYRQRLVREFHPIKRAAAANGAYATYLSGAGPAIMVMCPNERKMAIFDAIDQLGLTGQLVSLELDRQGLCLV